MDNRLFVDQKHLILLRKIVKKMSLCTTFKPSGILAGRNRSKLRGQGLDFEELRSYRAGDSLKDIDWKASSRSDKKLVRVFTEETDRPAIILCDQRSTMLFGSQVYTKSVIAAEIAALMAWLLLERGDRVGGLIIEDQQVRVQMPNRSSIGILSYLNQLATANKQLKNFTAPLKPTPSITKQLTDASVLLGRSGTLVVITDGEGLTTTDVAFIKQLAVKHNIIMLLVNDELELDYRRAEGLAISDGNLQYELTNNAVDADKFQQDSAKRICNLRQALRATQLPFGTLNTIEPSQKQLTTLLMGGRK